MGLLYYELLDIDECVEGTSLCSHICLNNNGSYSCTCRPGYYLAADKVTCLGIILHIVAIMHVVEQES